MYWPTKRVIMLLLWSAGSVWIASERLDSTWALEYRFWPIVLSHLLVGFAPWAVWWWVQLHRRLKSAAAEALNSIRREAILLGPAFDELASDAECLWYDCGHSAVRQYQMAAREISGGMLEGLRDRRGIDALERSRDEALTNAERIVTALELLAAHLVGLRLRQVECETVRGQIGKLQDTTSRATMAQEEASRALLG